MKNTPINKRLVYLLALLIIVAAGLASRHFKSFLPTVLNLYLGDALWAMMVFFLMRVLAPSLSPLRSALWALAFAYGIELSQLYQAPWINDLRHTTLGGLLLGFGFLWTDILAYTLGIIAGLGLDKLIGSIRNTVLGNK